MNHKKTLVGINIKPFKTILKKSLIFLTLLTFTSCSWGLLFVVGNSYERDIIISYKITDSQLSKRPNSYSFDEKLLNLYKKNKIRPLEIPNNAKYNEKSGTVTLTIKSGEAAVIGSYDSFESFREKILKSELKAIISKDSTLNTEELFKISRNWNRKIKLLEIK